VNLNRDGPKILVITGTDTGVGKTFVTTALVRAWRGAGVRVGAIKPVATGAARIDGTLRSADTEALLHVLEPGASIDDVSPMTFEPPLAPSIAARLQGTPLHVETVVNACRSTIQRWRDRADVVLIEGIGGFLCPIGEDGTFADLATALDCPVLVVARAGLGTLNHILLTTEAIQHRGLRVAGIILNQVEPESDLAAQFNPAELARQLGDVGPLLSLCYNFGRQIPPSELVATSPALFFHDRH
jgi:dethiobiotin synthetase